MYSTFRAKKKSEKDASEAIEAMEDLNIDVACVVIGYFCLVAMHGLVFAVAGFGVGAFFWDIVRGIGLAAMGFGLGAGFCLKFRTKAMADILSIAIRKHVDANAK